MASGSENYKGGESAKGNGASRARSKAIFLASAAIFVFVAAGVYLVAREPAKESSEELEFPRLSFDPAALQADMDNLRGRAANFKMRPEEVSMVEALGAIHRAEVSGDGSTETVSDAGAELTFSDYVARFRELARPYYRENPERYLRLGDHLALDFDTALNDLLAIAEKQGLQKTLEAGGPKVERIIQTGGGFLSLAVERGLISDRGELRAPNVLPQVLFRRKWCALAGFERQAGLSKTEYQVNLDFIVAFSGSESGRRQLRAIKELADLRPDYRADLAEAMVLEKNTYANEALKAYREILKNKPGDRAVESAVSRLEAAQSTKEKQ